MPEKVATGGRCKLEFTEEELQQVTGLAAMNCTLDEIATFFKCSRGTVQSRIKNDLKFLAAYEKGANNKKLSLKRWMWKAAANGNITMQIFLSKNMLGYSDVSRVDLGRLPDVVAVPVGEAAMELARHAAMGLPGPVLEHVLEGEVGMDAPGNGESEPHGPFCEPGDPSGGQSSTPEPVNEPIDPEPVPDGPENKEE